MNKLNLNPTLLLATTQILGAILEAGYTNVSIESDTDTTLMIRFGAPVEGSGESADFTAYLNHTSRNSYVQVFWNSIEMDMTFAYDDEAANTPDIDFDTVSDLVALIKGHAKWDTTEGLINPKLGDTVYSRGLSGTITQRSPSFVACATTTFMVGNLRKLTKNTWEVVD